MAIDIEEVYDNGKLVAKKAWADETRTRLLAQVRGSATAVQVVVFKDPATGQNTQVSIDTTELEPMQQAKLRDVNDWANQVLEEHTPFMLSDEKAAFSAWVATARDELMLDIQEATTKSELAVCLTSRQVPANYDINADGNVSETEQSLWSRVKAWFGLN